MSYFRNILVPVDFSRCSRTALEHALTLTAPGSRVDVLHVWAPPTYPMGPASVGGSWLWLAASDAELIERAPIEQELEAFVHDLEIPGGVTLRTRVQIGTPADAILEAASEYDLVVMGTHGRTGLARLFLGSVAARVVRDAGCPVLTIRQPDRAAAPSERRARAT